MVNVNLDASDFTGGEEPTQERKSFGTGAECSLVLLTMKKDSEKGFPKSEGHIIIVDPIYHDNIRVKDLYFIYLFIYFLVSHQYFLSLGSPTPRRASFSPLSPPPVTGTEPRSMPPTAFRSPPPTPPRSRSGTSPSSLTPKAR